MFKRWGKTISDTIANQGLSTDFQMISIINTPPPALSPLQGNKNNGQTVHPLTPWMWIRQENGEKYPSGMTAGSHVKSLSKIEEILALRRRGWTKGIRLNIWKRLKTKDKSSVFRIQWIWDEATNEMELYSQNKMFCKTSKAKDGKERQ